MSPKQIIIIIPTTTWTQQPNSSWNMVAGV